MEVKKLPIGIRTYRDRHVIENIRENVDERDSSASGSIPLTLFIRRTRAFSIEIEDRQFIDTPTRPTISHFFLVYQLLSNTYCNKSDAVWLFRVSSKSQ